MTAVPKGHFWRGRIDRFYCKNCGEHYDKHLHTDEASTCPVMTAERPPKAESCEESYIKWVPGWLASQKARRKRLKQMIAEVKLRKLKESSP